MSYEKLDIYNIAFELFIETHKSSLKLPNYELYELGSQLRRSADSVVTTLQKVMEETITKVTLSDFLLTLRQVVTKQFVTCQKSTVSIRI
jgi:four helix bundle protein